MKGGVLVVHDIFGLHTGRHAQYCDDLADEGWIVCMPDAFGDGRARADAALLPLPIKGTCNILELRAVTGGLDDKSDEDAVVCH